MMRSMFVSSLLVLPLFLIPTPAAAETPEIVCSNPPYDVWTEWWHPDDHTFPYFGEDSFNEANCKVHLSWHWTGKASVHTDPWKYEYVFHKISHDMDICDPC